MIKKMYVGGMRLITRLQFWLKGIHCGKGIRVIGNTIYIKAPKDSIEIGDFVNINSSEKANPIGRGRRTKLLVKQGGSIRIGNNVGMSNCTIVAHSAVCIGDNVAIGGGTCIYDTDFHSLRAEDRANGDVNVTTKSVTIGDGVFIGSDVLILKGVHIGNYAVIGAGAVVAKDIPAGEVWAGNPAQFVKKLY